MSREQKEDGKENLSSKEVVETDGNPQPIRIYTIPQSVSRPSVRPRSTTEGTGKMLHSRYHPRKQPQRKDAYVQVGI